MLLNGSTIVCRIIGNQLGGSHEKSYDDIARRRLQLVLSRSMASTLKEPSRKPTLSAKLKSSIPPPKPHTSLSPGRR
jgi:hypothetical protein